MKSHQVRLNLVELSISPTSSRILNLLLKAPSCGADWLVISKNKIYNFFKTWLKIRSKVGHHLDVDNPFFGSTIQSQSFCQKWIYNSIRSFHPPEKRIYDPILSDSFRSFPIRSLSCILKDMVPQILHFLNLRTCESERFISNEIARSQKIVILLRNANFSLKNAVCL